MKNSLVLLILAVIATILSYALHSYEQKILIETGERMVENGAHGFFSIKTPVSSLTSVLSDIFSCIAFVLLIAGLISVTSYKKLKVDKEVSTDLMFHSVRDDARDDIEEHYN